MAPAIEDALKHLDDLPEGKRHHKKALERLLENKDKLEKSPGLFESYLIYLKMLEENVEDSELKSRLRELTEKAEESCGKVGIRRCYLFMDYETLPKREEFNEIISREVAAKRPAMRGKYLEFPTIINEATIEERKNWVQNAPNPRIAKLHKDIAHFNYELGFITKEECEYITGEECKKCQIYTLPCALED